jgi:hypothetical protein
VVGRKEASSVGPSGSLPRCADRMAGRSSAPCRFVLSGSRISAGSPTGVAVGVSLDKRDFNSIPFLAGLLVSAVEIASGGLVLVIIGGPSLLKTNLVHRNKLPENEAEKEAQNRTVDRMKKVFKAKQLLLTNKRMYSHIHAAVEKVVVLSFDEAVRWNQLKYEILNKSLTRELEENSTFKLRMHHIIKEQHPRSIFDENQLDALTTYVVSETSLLAGGMMYADESLVTTFLYPSVDSDIFQLFRTAHNYCDSERQELERIGSCIDAQKAARLRELQALVPLEVLLLSRAEEEEEESTEPRHPDQVASQFSEALSTNVLPPAQAFNAVMRETTQRLRRRGKALIDELPPEIRDQVHAEVEHLEPQLFKLGREIENFVEHDLGSLLGF